MRSLYRRYRPVKLSEVVGQKQVTEPLANSLKEGKISHAYLFIGPRGTGKTSVARIFAHEVNGFPYTIEDDYVDIIEIDGASNRGIDNIRELREKVAIAPTAGKYKIYIIDEVHMLTKEAFNALLKTLEEPPEHAIFIMATTDAYKVPVTITSRSQTYTFRLAESDVIFPYIKSICEKEKILIDDDALKIVIKRGGGSFRDTLSLLDQISTLSDKQISKEMVVDALGLPEDEQIANLLTAYQNSDAGAVVNELRNILSSGIKPETLAEELISTIIAEPTPELLPLLAKLPDVKAPFAEARILVALMKEGVAERLFPGPASPLSTSYAGTRAEPPLQGEPVRSGRNIRLERSNRKLSSEKDASATPSFNWSSFSEKVKEASGALALQIASANYEVDGTTLKIYPENDFAKTFLSRDKNKKILIECADGLKVTVCDVKDNPKIKNDELISKMSDIMGGEVMNDGGGNPFN
ncbi:DNA polymerase III subunit gamma/tau [Candidatus Saccharibacteria bacterium]|nr:DNA polymerase III subunit gamma/tau [Candidatus Saccharibacteria bacterium]